MQVAILAFLRADVQVLHGEAFESCIVCYRGDTTTVVQFEGEAEWIVAGILRLGVPIEQAQKMVEVFAHEEMGCDLGKVPAGRFVSGFRCCLNCADKAGIALNCLYAQPFEGEAKRDV